MTPEQINAAIAESLGWVRISHPTHDWKDPHGDSQYSTPNFHGCLNACHEMEKSIRNLPDDPQWDLWAQYVSHFEEDPHATAPQRCEAYLKTKGIWR